MRRHEGYTTLHNTGSQCTPTARHTPPHMCALHLNVVASRQGQAGGTLRLAGFQLRVRRIRLLFAAVHAFRLGEKHEADVVLLTQTHIPAAAVTEAAVSCVSAVQQSRGVRSTSGVSV